MTTLTTTTTTTTTANVTIQELANIDIKDISASDVNAIVIQLIDLKKTLKATNCKTEKAANKALKIELEIEEIEDGLTLIFDRFVSFAKTNALNVYALTKNDLQGFELEDFYSKKSMDAKTISKITSLGMKSTKTLSGAVRIAKEFGKEFKVPFLTKGIDVNTLSIKNVIAKWNKSLVIDGILHENKTIKNKFFDENIAIQNIEYAEIVPQSFKIVSVVNTFTVSKILKNID